MAIRRILVHLGHHEQRGRTRLDAGFALAHRYDAQLHGLFIIEPAVLPAPVAGRGASLTYLSESIALLREQTAVIDAEFRELCARENVAWISTRAEGETLEILKQYSFCADLAIVGQQVSHGLDDAMSLHRSDYLPLLSSGPVLIMPRAGQTDVSAQNILIAWKPDRSCARALHDALPFLSGAKTVTLLAVDPPSEWDLPDTAVSEFLAGHGVQANIATRKSRTFEGTGDVILAAAKDLGSDMLVMGAHGHSRLTEWIFGGATHDVLRNMHIPVLMSH